MKSKSDAIKFCMVSLSIFDGSAAVIQMNCKRALFKIKLRAYNVKVK